MSICAELQLKTPFTSVLTLHGIKTEKF